MRQLWIMTRHDATVEKKDFSHSPSDSSPPPGGATVRRMFSDAPDTVLSRPSYPLLGGPPFPPPPLPVGDGLLLTTATSIMPIQLISYIIYGASPYVKRFFMPGGREVRPWRVKCLRREVPGGVKCACGAWTIPPDPSGRPRPWASPGLAETPHCGVSISLSPLRKGGS